MKLSVFSYRLLAVTLSLFLINCVWLDVA